MRVFITGATGTIGSAVVGELLTAGHQVLALARSDASAASLEKRGAAVLRGDLDDHDSLRKGAVESDGVIHSAFNHDDFSAEGFQKSMTQEAAAVETFGAALEGSGKPFVIASGTPIAAGRASTEKDPPLTDGPVGLRGRTAQAVLDLARRGVRSGIVRLPRSVHERGVRYGFASLLIETARRAGFSGYVGDGAQRWPAVHRLDAARLFRLVLERGEPGTVAHAVGVEGDSMRSIAEVIGRGLGLPAQSAPAEAFGYLGGIFALDQPSSSAWTREKFDWSPTHPTLLADLEAGNYPA